MLTTTLTRVVLRAVAARKAGEMRVSSLSFRVDRGVVFKLKVFSHKAQIIGHTSHQIEAVTILIPKAKKISPVAAVNNDAAFLFCSNCLANATPP